MKLIIVTADRSIVIDGEGRKVDLPRDDFTHLSWDGDLGYVQWRDEDPEIFTDASLLDPFVAAWEAVPPLPYFTPEQMAADDAAREAARVEARAAEATQRAEADAAAIVEAEAVWEANRQDQARHEAKEAARVAAEQKVIDAKNAALAEEIAAEQHAEG